MEERNNYMGRSKHSVKSTNFDPDFRTKEKDIKHYFVSAVKAKYNHYCLVWILGSLLKIFLQVMCSSIPQARAFDKQLERSGWVCRPSVCPGCPPPDPESVPACLGVWLLVAAAGRVAEIYIQGNIKQDFFFVFSLAVGVHPLITQLQHWPRPLIGLFVSMFASYWLDNARMCPSKVSVNCCWYENFIFLQHYLQIVRLPGDSHI